MVEDTWFRVKVLGFIDDGLGRRVWGLGLRFWVEG
jgi:hypothetical protein